MKTGAVEVQGEKVEVLNGCAQLPFQFNAPGVCGITLRAIPSCIHHNTRRANTQLETDPLQVKEALRMQYRYLDLRRPGLQEMLRLRSRVAAVTRAVLGAEYGLDAHGILAL
jgi:aspartyl-tRNA synthetase